MYKEFYYKKDRLNQLRGFIAVVQSGNSIRGAAKKLGLENPAVSKQVMALERDLNIQLFDRTKHRKLNLTSEGKIFYDKIVTAIQNIDGIFHSFAGDLQDERNNNLRIASIDAIIRKLMPFLRILKNKHPELNISLNIIPKENGIKKLIDQEVDLIFYPGDIHENYPIEVEKEIISEYKSYLILPLNHPLADKNDSLITREDLAKYPFGILPETIYIKSFENFVKEYELKCPINIENGSIDLIIEMVKANMCIAVINEIHIDENDKKELILKNAKYYLPQRFYYSFQIKNVNHKKIASEFLDVVKKNHNKIFH